MTHYIYYYKDIEYISNKTDSGKTTIINEKYIEQNTVPRLDSSYEVDKTFTRQDYLIITTNKQKYKYYLDNNTLHTIVKVLYNFNELVDISNVFSLEKEYNNILNDNESYEEQITFKPVI